MARAEAADAGGGDGSRHFSEKATPTSMAHPGKGETSGEAEAHWRRRRKHVLVLTSSGRPVWSRYGDEDELAAFVASLQALCAFAEDGSDTLHSFYVGDACFAFLHRGPLLLVAIASNGEHERQLLRQLTLLHSQLVAVLTARLERPFRNKAGYDLRPLLVGSDPLLQSLCRCFTWDPSTWLRSVQSLPLAEEPRRRTRKALYALTSDEAVCHAFLATDCSLIALANARGLSLASTDLILLLNMVRSYGSRRQGGSMVPVCLQSSLGKDALAYAHVTAVTQRVNLVCVCDSPAAVQQISEEVETVRCALSTSGDLRSVEEAASKGGVGVPMPKTATEDSESSMPSFVASPLWYFVYKRSELQQFVAPRFQSPLDGRRERKEVLRNFQRLHANVQGGLEDRPERVRYESGDQMVLLAYVGPTAELYMALDPMTKREEAVAMCHKLTSWLRTKSEQLFAGYPEPETSKLVMPKPPSLSTLAQSASNGTL